MRVENSSPGDALASVCLEGLARVLRSTMSSNEASLPAAEILKRLDLGFHELAREASPIGVAQRNILCAQQRIRMRHVVAAIAELV